MLKVKKVNDIIVLDFPASTLTKIEIPAEVAKAFHIQPLASFKGRDDYMLVFENENAVLQLKPDFQQLIKAKTRGVICTSKSEKYDFVSRFFAPVVGVNEDPVTGSAHTMLIPYWSKELDKIEMSAKQISARGGERGGDKKGGRGRRGWRIKEGRDRLTDPEISKRKFQFRKSSMLTHF